MAEAAAAANVSSNVWVASFERVALVAKESLGEVQEKLIQTAETAKLSEGGIGGGFGALGGFSALESRLALRGILSMKSRRRTRLDHLSAKTGIAVGTLSGLKLVVQEMGGDSDAVATGLVRLEKAQALAASGSGKALEAFHAIGISLKEVRISRPQICCSASRRPSNSIITALCRRPWPLRCSARAVHR